MDHIAEEIDQANEAAVREDAPQPHEFNEEESKAIIPIFKEDEQSDDEEERIRLHLQEDFDEAVDAEWTPAKIAVADDDIFQISMSGKPFKTPVQMWFAIPTTGGE